MDKKGIRVTLLNHGYLENTKHKNNTLSEIDLQEKDVQKMKEADHLPVYPIIFS